jgi:hypothetical protein
MPAKSGRCITVNLIWQRENALQTFFLAIPNLNYYYTPAAQIARTVTFLIYSNFNIQWSNIRVV